MSINSIKSKQFIIINVLFILLIITTIIGIWNGSFNTPLLKYLTNDVKLIEEIVLLKIRIPRVILAILVGASLSLSGACLQGLFRNPLADPGLIGVSAGAALGAATSIVIGSHYLLNFNIYMYLIPLFAILGAICVVCLLFVITKGFQYSNITYMLLAGIAINTFAGVGIGILTYISDDVELRGLTFWTMGSLGGAKWILVSPAFAIIILTIIWTLQSARQLDILQLGESEAYRLGVNVKRLKFKIIISSSIMVGISVALSGIIGFVGLVIPHIIRLMGGVNHKYLMVGSLLSGAILMVLADLICRVIVAPAELPVGLITSAIGAPFFLWLIFKMQKQ